MSVKKPKKAAPAQKLTLALASLKAKWKEVTAHNKKLKKELSAAMKAKAGDFKAQLKAAEEAAYEKALTTLEAAIEKKEAARKKALAAAEAQFEKAHAKKTGVKTKRMSATTKKRKTMGTKKPASGKKRGRPAKEKTME